MRQPDSPVMEQVFRSWIAWSVLELPKAVIQDSRLIPFAMVWALARTNLRTPTRPGPAL